MCRCNPAAPIFVAILAVSLCNSVHGSTIHILIDESLVLLEERQVSEYLQYLNTTAVAGDHMSIHTWPVRSWDAFELAAIDGKISETSELSSPTSVFVNIMAVLQCHKCRYLSHTYVTEMRFCHVTCWDGLAREWSECDFYLRGVDAFSSLAISTSNASESLMLFFDQHREEAIEPVIDSLAESTKGMYIYNREPIQDGGQLLEPHMPLSNATLKNISHFIISVDITSTIAILKQGFSVNVLGPEYNWLVDLRSSNSSYAEEALSQFMQGGDNVALVSLNRSHMTSPGTDVTEQCTDRGLVLDVGQIEHVSKVADSLQVKKCVGNCRSPSLLTTISSLTDTGQWTNLSHIFPKDFEGFHGRSFNIVTREYAPFVIVTEVNGTRQYGGLCIALLDVLAQTLDFKYNLFDVKDGKFGILENGSWNGMIGEVHRKEMDMAVSGITVSAEREEAVDFTFPYWEEPTAIFIRRTATNTKLFWVFRPLHYYVWLLIFAAFVVVAALITMFTHVSKNEKPPPKEDPLWHMKNALWYVMGAFFQQGGYQQPTTFPGQSMTGCWWCVVVVMYGIYTGNLIAFLAVTKIPLPFETLEEMTSQTEYKYGVEDGIIQMMLFQTAEGGLYKDIWKGIKSDPSNIVDSGEDGVRKVLHEKYAFIGDKTNIHTLGTATGNCDLVFIKEEFYKVGFGFALQDGWPYKKYFDSAIMKLVEGGFTEKWRREFWPTDVCVVKDQYVKSQAITLADLSGNFVILCAGITIATVLFFAEKLSRRLRQRGINCSCNQCDMQRQPETINQNTGSTGINDVENSYPMNTTRTSFSRVNQNGVHAKSSNDMQNGFNSIPFNNIHELETLRHRSQLKRNGTIERLARQNDSNTSYLDKLTSQLSTSYSKPPSPQSQSRDTSPVHNGASPRPFHISHRRYSASPRLPVGEEEPKSPGGVSASKVMLELL